MAAVPGHDDHQRVDVARHLQQGGVVAVRDVLAGAVVVAHRHPEGLGAARDRLADPAEPEDAEPAAGDGQVRERVGTLGRPPPGAQVPLGLPQLAHGHQQQRERGVGDLVVQHPRGVGDDDAALGGGVHVHAVVPDAEVRDDLQVGQPVEERRHRRAGARRWRGRARRGRARRAGRRGRRPPTAAGARSALRSRRRRRRAWALGIRTVGRLMPTTLLNASAACSTGPTIRIANADSSRW